MEAATAWATGRLFPAGAHRPDEDDALADALRWGFDAEAIAALRDQLGDTVRSVSVWLTNVPVVEAFLVVSTQWRTALVPTEAGLVLRHVGLDYAGARAALSAMRIRVTPHLWNGLAVMELAAKAALNGEPV